MNKQLVNRLSRKIHRILFEIFIYSPSVTHVQGFVLKLRAVHIVRLRLQLDNNTESQTSY